MSRALLLIACALAGALAAPAALANDSVAETAAGGLVLGQSRDIDMVSEDLYVSAREIRVRYVFRNRSARAVRTIVAFPMPGIDLSEDDAMDRARPRDFSTRVDGRPVAMQVERRAALGAVDHSALLAGLGVPVQNSEDGEGPTVDRALARLDPAQRRRLESLGLVQGYNDTENGRPVRRYNPRWTIRETWHWRQVFPAGRNIVVEHRYAPGAGGTATTALGNPNLRSEEFVGEARRRYCIDADFLAAAERLVRPGSGYINVNEEWISYILTTGGNWRAPIGDFRLVVDKGDLRNLVSFCGQGIRRIGPTQFEMRRRNWRPTRDLDVLILAPQREDE